MGNAANAKIDKKIFSYSRGQTLIETIVAIGLLAMGIMGGLALSVSSMGASEATLSQITATNLAREGIEVIRNMRDTNWINDTLVDCSEIDSGQLCYKDWLTKIYDFRGSHPSWNYRVMFNPETNTWSVERVLGGTADPYLLYRWTYNMYTTSLPAPVASPSQFYRRITIDQDSINPFQPPGPPRLLVQSLVWWTGKRCTADPATTPCKVLVEDYLTNWRNY